MANNKIRHMCRQGDVLLVARDPIPATARQVDREGRRIVLMHGEVTGHAHAVLDPEAAYLESGTGDAVERWLRAGPATVLVHEEHGAHDLVPGESYEQWYQYEYAPEALQLVAD